MPPSSTSVSQLLIALRARPGSSAALLASSLGVSVPTVHRLLAQAEGQVLAAGRARRTRYALRRALRGQFDEIPLFEVDEQGRGEHVASLACVHPHGTRADLAGTGWPVPGESQDGWWEGLPYPLYDMRPQGYMGRQFARAHHRLLGVPENPATWNDDDILHVLAHAGHDAPGALVLGHQAYEQWLARRAQAPHVIPPDEVGAAYEILAAQAVASGVPGSSAAGEFPKFSAMRHGNEASATPHVLVKFSGADDSAAVARWADLLVCEHLALGTLRHRRPAGLSAASSRVLRHGGRTFLEVERFDRHGLWGRSRVCSLETVNGALLGAGTHDWSELAARLGRLKLLDAATVHAVSVLWWFGRLIANTDMHLGNLSFVPQAGGLTLAPAYDMLPMLYAPLPGGEVAPRVFEPRLPLPSQRAAWQTACEAALSFWQQAAADARLSDAFRRHCNENMRKLEEAAAAA